MKNQHKVEIGKANRETIKALLKQGTTKRQISEQTGIHYITVIKHCKAIQEEDPSIVIPSGYGTNKGKTINQPASSKRWANRKSEVENIVMTEQGQRLQMQTLADQTLNDLGEALYWTLKMLTDPTQGKARVVHGYREAVYSERDAFKLVMREAMGPAFNLSVSWQAANPGHVFKVNSFGQVLSATLGVGDGEGAVKLRESTKATRLDDILYKGKQR